MNIATFLPIAAGNLPPLLLADSGYLGISQRLPYTLQEFPRALQELPRGFPIAFGYFLAAFLYPSRIAQRLSNNLCTFPSGFPIPFKNFPEAFQ
jgi:hypothetical protein